MKVRIGLSIEIPNDALRGPEMSPNFIAWMKDYDAGVKTKFHLGGSWLAGVVPSRYPTEKRPQWDVDLKVPGSKASAWNWRLENVEVDTELNDDCAAEPE